MKNNTYTLTIGIPAHNEEKNIVGLLESLCRQTAKTYTLEEIVVVCDGCTDNTAAYVLEFAQTHPHVVLLNDGERKGKAERLNQIYSRATSDLLLTIDADVLFPTEKEVEAMVKEMLGNPNVLLVGPRHVPVRTHTFWGRCAEYSYLSFEEAIFNWNDGQNMYALMGCASLLKKKLYKSFTYPHGTISDQNYLYAKATQMHANGFRLAKKSQVLFSPVTTLHDWFVLSTRSVRGDKNDVIKHFGPDVLQVYSMPKMIYIKALFKWYCVNPLYTTGAFLLNLLIRAFPYTGHEPHNGQWELASSSKEAIHI